MASLVTVGLIEKLRDDMAQAIAVDGVIEFKHDLVLRQICDLAIEALLAPEDSAALSDVRAERKRQQAEHSADTDDGMPKGGFLKLALQYGAHAEAEAGEENKNSRYRRHLVLMAAFTIAEVERLDREGAAKCSL